MPTVTFHPAAMDEVQRAALRARTKLLLGRVAALKEKTTISISSGSASNPHAVAVALEKLESSFGEVLSGAARELTENDGEIAGLRAELEGKAAAEEAAAHAKWRAEAAEVALAKEQAANVALAERLRAAVARGDAEEAAALAGGDAAESEVARQLLEQKLETNTLRERLGSATLLALTLQRRVEELAAQASAASEQHARHHAQRQREQEERRNEASRAEAHRAQLRQLEQQLGAANRDHELLSGEHGLERTRSATAESNAADLRSRLAATQLALEESRARGGELEDALDVRERALLGLTSQFDGVLSALEGAATKMVGVAGGFVPFLPFVVQLCREEEKQRGRELQLQREPPWWATHAGDERLAGRVGELQRSASKASVMQQSFSAGTGAGQASLVAAAVPVEFDAAFFQRLEAAALAAKNETQSPVRRDASAPRFPLNRLVQGMSSFIQPQQQRNFSRQPPSGVSPQVSFADSAVPPSSPAQALNFSMSSADVSALMERVRALEEQARAPKAAMPQLSPAKGRRALPPLVVSTPPRSPGSARQKTPKYAKGAPKGTGDRKTKGPARAKSLRRTPGKSARKLPKASATAEPTGLTDADGRIAHEHYEAPAPPPR